MNETSNGLPHTDYATQLVYASSTKLGSLVAVLNQLVETPTEKESASMQLLNQALPQIEVSKQTITLHQGEIEPVLIQQALQDILDLFLKTPKIEALINAHLTPKILQNITHPNYRERIHFWHTSKESTGSGLAKVVSTAKKLLPDVTINTHRLTLDESNYTLLADVHDLSLIIQKIIDTTVSQHEISETGTVHIAFPKPYLIGSKLVHELITYFPSPGSSEVHAGLLCQELSGSTGSLGPKQLYQDSTEGIVQVLPGRFELRSVDPNTATCFGTLIDDEGLQEKMVASTLPLLANGQVFTHFAYKNRVFTLKNVYGLLPDGKLLVECEESVEQSSVLSSTLIEVDVDDCFMIEKTVGVDLTATLSSDSSYTLPTITNESYSKLQDFLLRHGSLEEGYYTFLHHTANTTPALYTTLKNIALEYGNCHGEHGVDDENSIDIDTIDIDRLFVKIKDSKDLDTFLVSCSESDINTMLILFEIAHNAPGAQPFIDSLKQASSFPAMSNNPTLMDQITDTRYNTKDTITSPLGYLLQIISNRFSTLIEQEHKRQSLILNETQQSEVLQTIQDLHTDRIEHIECLSRYNQEDLLHIPNISLNEKVIALHTLYETGEGDIICLAKLIDQDEDEDDENEIPTEYFELYINGVLTHESNGFEFEVVGYHTTINLYSVYIPRLGGILLYDPEFDELFDMAYITTGIEKQKALVQISTMRGCSDGSTIIIIDSAGITHIITKDSLLSMSG